MPTATIGAPFGAIRIETSDLGVVTWVSPRVRQAQERVEAGFPAAVLDAFHAYMADGRKHPDVPVARPTQGFTGRVLDAMCRIRPGEVRTYGEVAVALGEPDAARAVGNACASNPVPIVVPCHRIVGSTGLGGYSGGGLGVKRWLLEHEGARVSRGAAVRASDARPATGVQTSLTAP